MKQENDNQWNFDQESVEKLNEPRYRRHKFEPEVSPIVKKDKLTDSTTVTAEPEKVLDSVRMIAKLERNQAIEKFCITQLKNKGLFDKSTIILMSNFMFLLKISLMHLIYVSLPTSPITGNILLVLAELVYIIMTSATFFKRKHLKSWFLIVTNWIRSGLFLSVTLSILIGFLNLPNRTLPLRFAQQKAVSRMIVAFVITEQLILLASICYVVITTLKDSRKKKQDPVYREMVEKQN